HHCAGKFVENNSGIRNYTDAIRAHGPAAVDEPAFHIRVIVPEIERCSGLKAKRIGIDQARSCGAISCIQHLYISSAWLHREVDWDPDSCGQREGRLAQRNGSYADLADSFACSIGNHGVRRQM